MPDTFQDGPLTIEKCAGGAVIMHTIDGDVMAAGRCITQLFGWNGGDITKDDPFATHIVNATSNVWEKTLAHVAWHAALVTQTDVIVSGMMQHGDDTVIHYQLFVRGWCEPDTAGYLLHKLGFITTSEIVRVLDMLPCTFAK